MSYPSISGYCTTVFLAVLFAASLPATAVAKTYKADCTKNASLQNIIDRASAGDTIEISGMCAGNILIEDKSLTLVGSGPGPNGITGTAATTDGVRIENSRGTHLEGLVISNPHFTGIRIKFQSDVTMTDCNVSNSAGGAGTAIWVEDNSYFVGTRLRLDNNLRGLGASHGSQAFCRDCDLNGNVNWAASAVTHSIISLNNSAVAGDRGINSSQYSYIDHDCVSFSSTHPCVLNANKLAGWAGEVSTVAFAGDFHGRLEATERSRVTLWGGRQMSNPGVNSINDNSMLWVEPYAGESQLIGQTEVLGFSNAQFFGGGTKLDGSLDCDRAGDAFVEDGIDLTNFAINGCNHAP